MKKALKIIGWIIGVIAGLFVLLSLVVAVIHRCKLPGDEKFMEEQGYLNQVFVDGKKINVTVYGSEDPKHTVVATPGLGSNNMSLLIRRFTDDFADENRIVVIDRAGYGMSDDTKEARTVENIVEESRAALKNAGLEGPYLLMPHSISGFYATYWMNRYPEEIEGVFFLDTTAVADSKLLDEGAQSSGSLRMLNMLTKIGYQRILLKSLYGSYLEQFDDTDAKIIMSLNMKSAYSDSVVSEAYLLYDNKRSTMAVMGKDDDIPKMYINAQSAIYEDEAWEAYKSAMEEINGPDWRTQLGGRTEEEFRELMRDYYNEALKPYLDQLKNCEVVDIPGPHNIYEYAPDELKEAFRRFLSELEE